MISREQFRAKIAKLLTDVEATSRVVKLRQVTQTGGNPRLGIGGTQTIIDSDVTPQPAVSLIKAEEVASSSGLLMPGDWRFIFDSTVSETALRTSQILFGDEVLNIVHVEPYPFQGGVVAWNVFARTVTPRT